MCTQIPALKLNLGQEAEKKTMHKNNSNSKTQSKKRDEDHDTERVWHWLWLQLLHRKKKNQYAGWGLSCADAETETWGSQSDAWNSTGLWKSVMHLSSVDVRGASFHFSPHVIAPPTWGANARGKKEQPVLLPISSDIDMFFIALHVPARPPTRV